LSSFHIKYGIVIKKRIIINKEFSLNVYFIRTKIKLSRSRRWIREVFLYFLAYVRSPTGLRTILFINQKNKSLNKTISIQLIQS